MAFDACPLAVVFVSVFGRKAEVEAELTALDVLVAERRRQEMKRAQGA